MRSMNFSPGERSYSCIINMGDKARAVIEELVTAGVIALEVLFPKRYAVRPLRIFQNLHVVTDCLAHAPRCGTYSYH